MPHLPAEKDSKILKLKVSIDNGMLNYFSKEAGLKERPEIEIRESSFPLIEDRLFHNIDVIAGGSFYFFCSPMATFVIILMEVVREKELHLRKVQIHFIHLIHLIFI